MKWPRRRSAPPLWILLDVLTVCVLVLLSQPQRDGSVTYKFTGLPGGVVVFAVDLPLDPESAEWVRYDRQVGGWVNGSDVTPHGRENFLCDECIAFLPVSPPTGSHLLVGLDGELRDRMHAAFFAACQKGDCAPVIYIDGDGRVSHE